MSSLRYSRQEVFQKIGKNGQEKLKNSRVAIIGLGGLGSNSAQLLTRAGIGEILLIDKDIVELSNLQRQSLFTEEDINKPKATQALKYLKKVNSNIKIKAETMDLYNENIIKLLDYDLILDCSDNLKTRFLINEFAFKNKIPWIYASALESNGYVLNILPGEACFRCIFKETSAIQTSNTTGIINTIPAIIASIQVTEAIKTLLGQECTKELIHFNVWDLSLNKIKVKKNPNCPICSKKTRL